MNASYLYYGVRHLSRKTAEKGYRKLRGAILGIAVSLIPLLVVIEVSNGMISGITERYLAVGTYHLQVKAFAETSMDILLSVAEDIENMPNVSHANPMLQGLSLAHSQNGSTGLQIRAVKPGYLTDGAAMGRYISVLEGSLGLQNENSIVLNKAAALELKVQTGDEIRILTSRESSTGKPILRQSRLTVDGVFTTGYHELDSLASYITLEKGATLFRDIGSKMVAIKISDPYVDLGPIVQAIGGLTPRNWYTFTWRELEEAMFRTFETTQNLLILIMVLIICVASVNISGSLMMLAMEKEQDIAILMSAGANPKGVLLSFLFVGFVAGMAGTALGMVSGLLLSININPVLQGLEWAISGVWYLGRQIGNLSQATDWQNIEILGSSFYLDEIPIRLRFSDIWPVGILSIGMAVFSSWFPAFKASRIRPVEALRRH